VAIRPLVSKILGPPAVLFLVSLACYVAYQIVSGALDAKAMKSRARTAIERFHEHFNRDDFTSACENEYRWEAASVDCIGLPKSAKSQYGAFKKEKSVELTYISEPPQVRAETISVFEKENSEKYLLWIPSQSANWESQPIKRLRRPPSRPNNCV
jgi:hypothetical protein